MIFNFRRLTKTQKITGITACILAIINIKLSQSSPDNLLYGIFSGIIVFSLLLELVDKKEIWSKAAVLIPFLFTIYQLLQLDYSIQNIDIIISIQLIILFLIYLYYGESLFNIIWEKDFFTIKDYWERLIDNQFNRLVKLLLHFIVPSLLGLHIILTILYAYERIWVLSIHNFILSILLSFILIDMIKNLNKLNIV